MSGAWKRSRLVVLALALGGTAGCVYIGNGVYDEKKDTLDQDQDGVVDKEDCDELDATRFPGNTEVPGDRIDQDCDGFDVVDLDGDGYPFISYAEWVAPDADVAEFWQPGVQQGSDDVDCDDDPDDDSDQALPAAEIYPGQPDDVYYDGVDADCAGNNDYDRDGDGYVYDDFIEVAPAELTTGGAECDDDEEDVNPGVVSDDWYDGVDSNCDGLNDFDQDGDDYISAPRDGIDADEWYDKFDEFLVRHRKNSTTLYAVTDFYEDGVVLKDDCVDDEHDVGAGSGGSSAPSDPVDIHPDAADDPYDGVDEDCAFDNDFDQDGDGYIQTQDLSDYETFIDEWELDGDDLGYVGIDDCDDGDGAIYPTAIEILHDSADQDCDGEANWTPLESGSVGWRSPRNVVVGGDVVSADSARFALTTIADESTLKDTEQPGITLYWERGDRTFDSGNNKVWQNPTASATNSLGYAVDMVGSGSALYVATTYLHPTSAKASLYIGRLTWSGSNYEAYPAQEVTDVVNDVYVDVQAGIAENGEVWMFGCGGNSVAFAAVADDGSQIQTIAKGYLEGVSAQNACFIEPPATTGGDVAVGHSCGTTCKSYDLTDVDESSETGTVVDAATQPYSADAFTTVGENSGWRTFIEGGALAVTDGVESYALLESYSVQYAEVAEDEDGEIYVLAVVADETADGKGDIVLAYGDPDVPSSWVEELFSLSVGGTTYNAQTSSIYVAPAVENASEVIVHPEQIMLAFSGTGDSCSQQCLGTDPEECCDVVAWAWLDPS